MFIKKNKRATSIAAVFLFLLALCLQLILTGLGSSLTVFSEELQDAPVGTNLADFLVDVNIQAPMDDNGNYVIRPGDTYELSFTFRENENLQFDNDSDLVYVLPEGLIVPDMAPASIDIGIRDDQGNAVIAGNTVVVSGGRLIVRFNRDDPNFERLKAVANASFVVGLSARIAEGAESIVFNSNIGKNFVFEQASDLTIDKTVAYDMENDRADYVITVTSHGHNENVTVTDTLTGTALTLSRDAAVTSSVHGTVSPSIDYESIENGFQFHVAEMADGEVLTIRCSAAVDNTKISSNGTVAQTGNTARVTSDGVPDGKEAAADFAGQAAFSRIKKQASGTPVQIGEGLYEQSWTILVNEDHKLAVGGTDIHDWIVDNSRPFMSFTGEGLSVRVTFEDGTVEERAVPFGDLRLHQTQDRIWGWSWRTPVSDQKAFYEISCKTLITTEGALGDLQLINGAQVFGSYDEGRTTVGVIGEDQLKIKKEAEGTTATESEWKITVTVPGSGLPELHIVDDCPKQEGYANIDNLMDGSMTVEGLIEGESWRMVPSSNGRSFAVHFYKTGNQGDADRGVLPTPDGSSRDIVIRFKTAVNQDWLDMAAEDGYTSSGLYTHRNYASAWSGSYRTATVDASVIPVKPLFKKSFVERSETVIGGISYPVFRYTLFLSGDTKDGAVIEDAFETRYFRLFEEESIVIRGGRTAGALNNTDGAVSATAGPDGVVFTVDRFPRSSSGEFYPYYELSYALVVKDADALEAMNEEAAREPGGIVLVNTASWNGLTSESRVNHTYYPYVDKELVTQASADNGYVAEFKLVINPYAEDLDPASDVLQIQDELSSNLRLLESTMTIVPEAEGIRTQFDSETNTVSFFDVPDQTRFEISYQARVLGKGNVPYSNTIRFGRYERTVEETVQIDASGAGTGSNPSITLIKRDAQDISATLSGATFQLFYLSDGMSVPVVDRNRNPVFFTTGADGTVLVAGNQSTLGWTLWEDRTYQLIEVAAPVGYDMDETPVEFVLSDAPSSQAEYDIVGDSLTIWNTRSTPEEPTPEDPIPEEPTPEEPTPEDPIPEEPTPEAPIPEEPTPEDPVPEEPTPEDPVPEEPTPEAPTPEAPKTEEPKEETPAPKDPTPKTPQVWKTRWIWTVEPPKTGDDSGVAHYVILLGICLLSMSLILFARKK